MHRIRFVLVVAVAIVSVSSPALAGDPEPLTRNYDALSDQELEARTLFILDRLEAGQDWATRWQWGWTAGYATGIVIGTAQAVMTNDGHNRAAYITTAVKATIGTTRLLLQPHPGWVGSDNIRVMPVSTRGDKIQRLRRAEDLLSRVAKKAEERTNWKAHAGNVLLNAAGAAATWAWGDTDDAYKNLAIGLAVGEAHIWSAPSRGPKDLADYQAQFGMKSTSRFNWRIAPTVGGAALHVTW